MSQAPVKGHEVRHSPQRFSSPPYSVIFQWLISTITIHPLGEFWMPSFIAVMVNGVKIAIPSMRL